MYKLLFQAANRQKKQIPKCLIKKLMIRPKIDFISKQPRRGARFVQNSADCKIEFEQKKAFEFQN